MEVVELRDPNEARRFLLQGLWLQRAVRPAGANVKQALEWASEIASSGQPLPPIGFVADLGAVAFGLEAGKFSKSLPEVPGWPAGLARRYEDHVLGKIYADWTFERASDALRRYTGRDRARGLAYVVKQIRDRGRLGGIELSPAVIRGLAALSGDDCLNQGYELLTRDGPMPLLVKQYDALVSAARRMAEWLGQDDIIAIEQRVALADMGQYVAHRQILQTTAKFESRLPTRPVRPLAGRKEVPTRVPDEDQYPVGGYSSISNRGSIESLLHSQLAFMEPQERPDLFDVKFVRDELFFYSRDENQFLRRRREFVFIFDPSLVAARYKDAELPCQRIVLALSAVLTLIRRLTDWLSADALRFELIFPKSKDANSLADEAGLFEILLSELRAAGTVVVRHGGINEKANAAGQASELTASALASSDAAVAYADGLGRIAQVHVLLIGQQAVHPETESAVVAVLGVNGPRPSLIDGHGVALDISTDDAFDEWVDAVIRILQLWV